MSEVVEIKGAQLEDGTIVHFKDEVSRNEIQSLKQSQGSQWNIGNGLKVDADTNTLSVDVAKDFEGDNTRPVEAALMDIMIGNVEILLKSV